MTYEHPGGGGLDYQTCRYGTSRVLFRGPRQKLLPPYAVFFGGSETYGRFVRSPYPDLIAQRTGLRCVNMGCVNAGPDVFAADPALLGAAARANATVIQLPGAHNLSNRFYAVHPRRNDRFLSASNLLMQLYPDVDFTEFSFTRHLLGTLEGMCSERFDTIVDELKACWLTRMKLILSEAGPQTVLLWLSVGPPPREARSIAAGNDPLFVDQTMVDELALTARSVVTVVPSRLARATGTKGMIHTEFEASVASETIGPAVHEEIAEALIPTLHDLRDGGTSQVAAQ